MTVYSIFSAILEYPKHPIWPEIERLCGLLGVEAPTAEAPLREFQAATSGLTWKRLQEVYTEAFDLRPESTVNLSYHMFGEDARRGVFMAEMKGRMEGLGISVGVEIPDHLALILQYIDLAGEEEELPLIEDCLLPSLKKMYGVLSECGNSYALLLRSLEEFLQVRRRRLAPETEMVDAARMG